MTSGPQAKHERLDSVLRAAPVVAVVVIDELTRAVPLADRKSVV